MLQRRRRAARRSASTRRRARRPGRTSLAGSPVAVTLSRPTTYSHGAAQGPASPRSASPRRRRCASRRRTSRRSSPRSARSASRSRDPHDGGRGARRDRRRRRRALRRDARARRGALAVTDVDLRSIRASLQGVIPSPFATCSADGMPNVIYLSLVAYVDAERVAISRQFLSQDAREPRREPVRAGARRRSRDRRAARARPALPPHRDRGRDVRVDAGQPRRGRVADRDGRRVPPARRRRLPRPALRVPRRARARRLPRPADLLEPLEHVARRLVPCTSYEEVARVALEALDDQLGLAHAILLAHDARAGPALRGRELRLRGLGGRRRGRARATGSSARPRRGGAWSCSPTSPRSRTMASAVTRSGRGARSARDPAPRPAGARSAAAVPLLVGDDVLGVLYLESERAAAFVGAWEPALRLLGAHLAAALAARGGVRAEDPHARGDRARPSPGGPELEVTYYQADDTVLVRRRVRRQGRPRPDPLVAAARARRATGGPRSPTASCASTSRSGSPRATTTSRRGCSSCAAGSPSATRRSPSSASAAGACSSPSRARCGSSRCPRRGRGGPDRELLGTRRDLGGDAAARRWDGAAHAHHRSPQRRTDRRHRRRSRRHHQPRRSSSSAASPSSSSSRAATSAASGSPAPRTPAVWPGMRANTSGAMTRFSDRPTPARLADVPERRAGRRRAARPSPPAPASRCARASAPASCPPARRARAGRSTCRTSPPGASTRVRVGRRRRRVRSLHRAADARRSCGSATGVDVVHSSAYRGPDALRGPAGPRRRQLDQRPGDRRRPRARPVDHGRQLGAPAALDHPQGRRGRPADQVWFTAFAALLGRTLPPEALAAGLRAQLEAAAGRPGRRRRADAARTTSSPPACRQSQHYLPLVAEGRIDARPGIAGVDGRRRALRRRHGGDRRRGRARHRATRPSCPTSPRSPRRSTR